MNINRLVLLPGLLALLLGVAAFLPVRAAEEPGEGLAALVELLGASDEALAADADEVRRARAGAH